MAGDRRWQWAALGLATVLFVSILPGSGADAPVPAAGDAERVLADRSAALVTVRFNLSAGGGDAESTESEITGVMIDPKGLVLCSNMQLTGLSVLMSGMTRGAAMPTNIRIMAGEDAQGVKARLLARDSELDLAWIEVEEPPAKAFAFVDLSKAIKPRVGQRVFSVRRMGKYFDRLATVREAQVSGMARKPRELYILGGTLNADFGLPVFAASGEVVGVTIMPISDDNEEELRGNPMAMLGGISGILDMFGGVVLPADEVLKATRRARENPQTQPAAKDDDETAGSAAPDEPEEDDKP